MARPTGSHPQKPTFETEIRRRRLQRKMTVHEVAEQMGVSRMAIYHWEHGKVRPRADNLTALCKTLRLPIRATRELANS